MAHYTSNGKDVVLFDAFNHEFADIDADTALSVIQYYCQYSCKFFAVGVSVSEIF